MAAEHPLATRVFHRHGIDFCCNGGKTLQEACVAQGVDLETVLEEIRTELRNTTTPEERWVQAPLKDLVDHILVTYHQPLQEELPRLETMARKVLAVHGDKDPGTLSELVKVYAGLKAELDQHMVKEERILFPMINQGQGAMAGGPVSVMQQEHDFAGAALKRLRELTNDYQAHRRVIPGEPSGTDSPLWRNHSISTSTWKTTSFFPGR